MARRARGRAAASSLLSRRLHPAGGARRPRVPNKAVVYDLLFRAAAETLTTIAADPKHLGARIGFTAVLHTWGSALTHHPHVHVIVPGGGLSPDGERWIACKRGFFLPVRVLSRLFRRLFLDGLAALRDDGRLAFFGDLAPLADKNAFDAALAPLRRCEWVVYAKRPFAGPKAVLAYLSRYTHRVAISNSRLIALDEAGVTFKWKDYRIKGRDRLKTMTLDAPEFIRRFLLHGLPSGFHRIRHYGLFAGAVRARNIERARQLLAASTPESSPNRGRRRNRNTFARASMPLLRRPNDHHRNLRRRPPGPAAIPVPDHDRLLMTIAALSPSQRRFSSPPAARQSRKPISSQARQSFSKRSARARPAHLRNPIPPPSSPPSAKTRPPGPATPPGAPAPTFKSP